MLRGELGARRSHALAAPQIVDVAADEGGRDAVQGRGAAAADGIFGSSSRPLPKGPGTLVDCSLCARYSAVTCWTASNHIWQLLAAASRRRRARRVRCSPPSASSRARAIAPPGANVSAAEPPPPAAAESPRSSPASAAAAPARRQQRPRSSRRCWRPPGPPAARARGGWRRRPRPTRARRSNRALRPPAARRCRRCRRSRPRRGGSPPSPPRPAEPARLQAGGPDAGGGVRPRSDAPRRPRVARPRGGRERDVVAPRAPRLLAGDAARGQNGGQVHVDQRQRPRRTKSVPAAMARSTPPSSRPIAKAGRAVSRKQLDTRQRRLSVRAMEKHLQMFASREEVTATARTRTSATGEHRTITRAASKRRQRQVTRPCTCGATLAAARTTCLKGGTCRRRQRRQRRHTTDAQCGRRLKSKTARRPPCTCGIKSVLAENQKCTSGRSGNGASGARRRRETTRLLRRRHRRRRAASCSALIARSPLFLASLSTRMPSAARTGAHRLHPCGQSARRLAARRSSMLTSTKFQNWIKGAGSRQTKAGHMDIEGQEA